MIDLDEMRREAHAGNVIAALAVVATGLMAGLWLGWIVWLVTR